MNRKKYIVIVVLLSIGVLISYLSYYLYAKDRPQSQPDFSPASSIKISEETVTIDFTTCTPDLKLVDTPIGSTIIEVRGKEFDICLMNYGRGDDNANLNQKLPIHCEVPVERALQTFRIINTGVEFGQLEELCTR